ncbi:glycosyltransferase [Tsukamurella soli]|uniref:Glycosyltransferase 2-like domain-containing protein n=1 Tax=Tsukamurella soli TaxID=644556 RepID=A0ABP8JJC8_9ACTN
MKLSVLMLSTDTRYDTHCVRMEEELFRQRDLMLDADEVEILVLTDAKGMTVGRKRQSLVSIAQGEYVMFVDDDDRIEPDMLESVLDGIIESHADVVCYRASVSLNGGKPKVCRYSKDFRSDRNTATEYLRLPNHLMAVKRELAMQAGFPDKSFGEDSDYARNLLPLLETEHQIPRVLYHYDFSDETSETAAKAPYLADVVILSNGKTEQQQAMTQKAIDTCIDQARPDRVNVIVMEGQPDIEYERATTVLQLPAFNYNREANRGIRMGGAPWVMVANNDLLFGAGWLRRLLAANHPVVSPKCPRDPRQRMIRRNTRGDQVGRHFSGWAFLSERAIWEKVGGWDECVSFWASDNCVVAQLKEIGVQPMLVPLAQVTHLGSQTLQHASDKDDLMWAQIRIFNEKYGEHIFEDNPRYKAWRVAHVDE